MPRTERLQANRALLKKIQNFLPKAITSEEMACIDRNAAALGISQILMMENAGARVAEHIVHDAEYSGKEALIVAGLGNNGGDGLVVARHLSSLGWIIDVVLLGQSKNLGTEEARANWKILQNLDTTITLHQIRDSTDLDLLKDRLEEHSLVVDAILGTGVQGELREPTASAVRLINSSNKQVVAVDTPTGLDPSSGLVHGEAVRAKMTVTFHRNKRGFDRQEEYTGKLIVADIGIPLEAELYVGPGDVDRVVKSRRPISHKGDYGYVLVIGGSEIYSGAPALAALSALRTGSGLAIIAAPEEVANVIRAVSPSLIVHPLPGKVIGTNHLDEIQGLLQRVDAVVLGPGIGLDPETGKAVEEILELTGRKGIPILVDADAIKLMKDKLGRMDNAKLVLTPHAGEFKVITGIEVREGQVDRIDVAAEFAKNHECVLVLKGHQTIITDGKRLKINRTGNPAMATGGSGDVLSGCIGAFLAQGRDPFSSAAAGAFINGRAGDLAYQAKGYHIIAPDLVEMIPEVLRPYDKEG